MPQKQKINDAEREMWINNDEGLNTAKRDFSRFHNGGMRGFIRANRQMIDAVIGAALNTPPRESWHGLGSNPIVLNR
jgi:hypothetical protein